MTGFFLLIRRNICLGLVSLAFLASAALAQPVTVIGPITPGDCTDADNGGAASLRIAVVAAPGTTVRPTKPVGSAK